MNTEVLSYVVFRGLRLHLNVNRKNTRQLLFKKKCTKIFRYKLFLVSYFFL